MSLRSRDLHVIRRPEGPPREADFQLVETRLPDAGAGEVLIQNLVMSADPATRVKLAAEQPLNQHLIAGGIGRVLQSRDPQWREGEIVRHRGGYREFFILPGMNPDLVRLNADPALPVTVYMHALGGTGLVAYGGMLEIARAKAGEQVFVSTAAGAVGSVAAQIGKLKGCYVVGSTGAEDKKRWLLDELKLDAVINYREEKIGEALTRETPKGLDVYFDNVGGDHLDAALARMNVLGRIAVCGMISTYNGGGDAVRNLFNIIYGRVSLRGFVPADLAHIQAQFEEEMTGWLKSGCLHYRETIYDGIAQAPKALAGLFEGTNTGKTLVRISDAI